MSLSDAERSALAKKVGSTASIMASSVVKLYLASPNPKANKKDPTSVLKNFPDLSDSQWSYTHVMGALVLVVDRPLDTFLFRIYDIEHPHELRFEYELYEDIEYKALDPQFHSFEMDDCVGGFCFASKDEAPKFLSKVTALKPSAKASAVDALKGKKKEKGGGWFSSSTKKKDKQQGLEVSAVMNVTHTQHIGINPDGTFDLNNISPEWKALFRQAGIKKKDLANPETARAIVATIAQTTGIPIRTERRDPDPIIDTHSEEAKTMYTPDQLAELEKYQAEVKRYEEELAAYEAEQAALAAWERDNAKYLAEKEEKDRKEREAATKREREERERAAAEKAQRELEQLAAQQRELEEELAAKEKEREEAEKQKARLLKEAVDKGAKLPPAPPPRKAAVPHIAAPIAQEPVAAPRRRTSIVEKVVKAVVGPTPEELAKEEEERRKAEEDRGRAEEERRKKNEEELERLRAEERKRLDYERERIRAEIEVQIRAEEDIIRKAAEEERRKMRDDAAQEQERLQRELAEAKSAAEKARIEAAAESARHEAERLRLEQEALERKAAEERERARQASEQAQREQEEILLQLQVMQLKTLEARRLVEEEERRQEELRKEAMKKRAPPIPARLPDKPPLPPPPAAPPRPPQAPALPPMPPPGPGTAAKLPPSGGLGNVLKGLGTVELRKAENVVDKSVPNISGKMGRDEKKNALLGALEKGVALKKVDGPSASSSAPTAKNALPQLQKMESNVQNTIMAKLVETMNMRRGALAGDDSDDDDWSD